MKYGPNTPNFYGENLFQIRALVLLLLEVWL